MSQKTLAALRKAWGGVSCPPGMAQNISAQVFFTTAALTSYIYLLLITAMLSASVPLLQAMGFLKISWKQTSPWPPTLGAVWIWAYSALLASLYHQPNQNLGSSSP